MNVKVCGITRLEDAQRARDLGATFLGFIFHEASPRCVKPEEARVIADALRGQVRTVGVFVDATVEHVRDFMTRAGLDIAQLHGEESLEHVTASWPDVWKALRVRHDASSAESAAAFEFASRYSVPVLLDARSERGAGGTGKLTDWNVAARIAREHRLILAGGLSSANVGEAIRTVAPWCVDVSSGVEDAPGIKNAQKMSDLFRSIRRADGDA